MMLGARRAAAAAAAEAAAYAGAEEAGRRHTPRPCPPPVSHVNPVVAALKAMGLVGTLESVMKEHRDDEIGQKLQGLVMLLGHL